MELDFKGQLGASSAEKGRQKDILVRWPVSHDCCKEEA